MNVPLSLWIPLLPFWLLDIRRSPLQCYSNLSNNEGPLFCYNLFWVSLILTLISVHSTTAICISSLKSWIMNDCKIFGGTTMTWNTQCFALTLPQIKWILSATKYSVYKIQQIKLNTTPVSYRSLSFYSYENRHLNKWQKTKVIMRNYHIIRF